MNQERHRAVQAAKFARADPAHFEWQTDGPFFAETEARLLADVRPRGRLLEVGCGDGANLVHLARQGGAERLHGCELFPGRLAFARDHVPGLRAVVADAARLPYADRAFDVVLVRDVLHHVADRAAVLAEAWRVTAAGGTLAVVEPNVRNPMMLGLALLARHERGLLASTPGRVRAELEALPGRGRVGLRAAQPLPVERLLLHPGLGASRLGAWAPARAALRLADRWHRLALPRAAWAYLVATVDRPA